MNKINDKVIIIGLDGATFDLMMPWIRQDKLPNIKKMIETGTMSNLESTIPPLTPVAWKSFMTGKNPGSHGTFDFYYVKPGTYDRGIVTRIRRKNKTLWGVLSEYGKTCCVFNVPHTYPPEKIKGYIVSGFLSPSLHSDFTFPKSLKMKILKEFPNYRIHEQVSYSETDDGREIFYKEILRIADIHVQTAKFLLNEFDWNFCMFYFRQIDILQHFFWKYMDKSHPLYNSEEGSKYGNKILELYQFYDKKISEILDKLPKNSTAIIMSDHGFGAHYGNFYVNNWLMKKSYLKIKKSIGSTIKYKLATFGFTPEMATKFISNLGIDIHKFKLDKIASFEKKHKIINKLFLSLKDVDWMSSKAFSLGYYGPIFINLKQRFPEGNIEKNLEYEKLKLEIRDELLKVENNKLGGKIIDKVWLRDDLYRGAYTSEAPDIIFSMRNFSIASSALFEFGSNKLFSNPIIPKSGDHRLNGILIMNGPKIRKGLKMEKAKIIDLFPTIMDLLNCPIPSDVEGKILSEAYIE